MHEDAHVAICDIISFGEVSCFWQSASTAGRDFGMHIYMSAILNEIIFSLSYSLWSRTKDACSVLAKWVENLAQPPNEYYCFYEVKPWSCTSVAVTLFPYCLVPGYCSGCFPPYCVFPYPWYLCENSRPAAFCPPFFGSSDVKVN